MVYGRESMVDHARVWNLEIITTVGQLARAVYTCRRSGNSRLRSQVWRPDPHCRTARQKTAGKLARAVNNRRLRIENRGLLTNRQYSIFNLQSLGVPSQRTFGAARGTDLTLKRLPWRRLSILARRDDCHTAPEKENPVTPSPGE